MAYIGLGVSDLPRSVAFYRDTLGLSLQFQHGGLAFFGAGPVTLMLSLEIGKARTPLAGAIEVVFAVDGVKPAWRRLAAKRRDLRPRAAAGDRERMVRRFSAIPTGTSSRCSARRESRAVLHALAREPNRRETRMI